MQVSSVMWWHKIIEIWTKLDHAVFVVCSWVLVFSFSVLVVLAQATSLNLTVLACFSFIMVPVAFVITYVFQSYSSNYEEIGSYHALTFNDFEGDRLLKKDRILALFYAAWCPFCWKTFPFLKILNPNSNYKVFQVDLSDEDSLLWESFEIDTVPTLIAFNEGREFGVQTVFPCLV